MIRLVKMLPITYLDRSHWDFVVLKTEDTWIVIVYTVQVYSGASVKYTLVLSVVGNRRVEKSAAMVRHGIHSLSSLSSSIILITHTYQDLI